MSNAREMLTKARAGLILEQPFFGSLALRLTLVEDTKTETACTDGKCIRYNPKYIENLSLPAIKGLLCHEVMHCANNHTTRRDGRSMAQWNIACDYAINPLIESCNMTLPKGGLVDPAFSGMSAEQIFSRLPPSQNGSGDDPGKCGGVEDSKDEDGNTASESDKSMVEQEWKVALAQAAQQAKAMGQLPSSIERSVADMLEPVLDWRELLRRFVDTAAKNDYSWSPPNRRYAYLGVYLPSLRSQELKNITMVLDTSASITQDNLRSFASELRSIVEDYRANATVMYCDSKVAGVEYFDSNDTLDLHPKGGGGTDFCPPFEKIERDGECPACLIYQTDGKCYSFPATPPYPVLWVLTEKNLSFNPPFGEVLFL
jgi:predicted metal-dependent peptidase